MNQLTFLVPTHNAENPFILAASAGESTATPPAASKPTGSGESNDKWHQTNPALGCHSNATLQPGEVACDSCGEIFKPKRPWGRYCSTRCRQAGYRERKNGATDDSNT